ncbi:hypothetical protein ACPOL_5471 [Acidisarcina polymorpha]|uniref:Uncharacterized protein n=1 Tax=Acidisarcina polymorpha TaxID=2211140 RepID=A0A2Z5G6V5_9BACT|nr:hypothetical protein ACPOL_5471 [Acidisarcina polymorpha]
MEGIDEREDYGEVRFIAGAGISAQWRKSNMAAFFTCLLTFANS